VTTRRGVMAACALALSVVGCADARAQAPLPRIGVLALADIPYVNDALRRGLRAHGLVDGQNIVIVDRSAGGRVERLPMLAGELVAGRVELIVAMGAGPARAAKQATASIPIVMAPVGNPVEGGFVTNLARPGGNITGVSLVSLDLAAKRIAIAKELLPNVERVVVLMTTHTSSPEPVKASSREAARRLGVHVDFIDADGPADLERAFVAAKQARADVVVVTPSPLFNSERERLSGLAQRYRMPVIGEAREFAASGFVIGYGPSIGDATYRAAAYVDKILKGANPGDLPVDQPLVFEMTVNLKAARALGIMIPQSLLVRADEVIQ
jgi:putative tryptophan/tyrosine transport system substrate-binding protein